MLIEIEPGVRLFVDVEGPALVPDGPSMRWITVLSPDGRCVTSSPGLSTPPATWPA